MVASVRGVSPRRWIPIACVAAVAGVAACNVDRPTEAMPGPLRYQGGPDTSLTITYSTGVTTSSGIVDVVGDKFGVQVNSGRLMTKIKWSIPNALIADSYTVDSGTIQRDTGTVTNAPNGIGSAGLGRYWDEHSGTRVISATVTFQVGGSKTVACTVYVHTPTANYFRVKTAPLLFGQVPIGQLNVPPTTDTTSAIAFYQKYPGEVMTANVNTTEIGGQFGFMQLLVDSTWENSTDSGFWYQRTSDTAVMDAPSDSLPFDVLMASARNPRTGISYPVGANQNNVLIPPGTDTVLDMPALPYTAQRGHNGAHRVTAFGYKDTFTTYLVFQAQRKAPMVGVWVAIGKVNWSQSASATYKGPNPGTNADFLNPANWTHSESPTSGTTINGSLGNSIPTWKNYYGNVKWQQ